MSVNLGEDLVFNILLRLPVISLLRCKCVCKSWFSLIASPIFISKHLQLCNSTRNPNLLLKIDSLETNNFDLDRIFIVSYETLQVVETQDHPPRIHATWLPKIVGSCNGLVCLYGNGVGVIWNPATRETKVMPRSSGHGNFTEAVAFGFDAGNDDYKVFLIHISTVKIADFLNADADADWFGLEVYSLRDDSWELITGIEEMRYLAIGSKIHGVYTNGVFSWLAFDEIEDGSSVVENENFFLDKQVGDEIVSYDFNNENEVIIRTPLPIEIGVHVSDKKNNYVGVVNGYLAVINPTDDSVFDLWVLREFGMVESWTRLFTTRPLHWVSTPYTWVFWKNGLVLWDLYEQQLFLYDSASHQKCRIGVPVGQYYMDFVTYRESLVPIDRQVAS